jgi:hypothetical protein
MNTTDPTPLDQQGSLSTVRPGMVNATNEPLYSFNTYASAGQTQLTFFQTVVGSAANGYGDTNMELAGQISAGNQFEARGLEVVFQPGINTGLIQQPEANKLAYGDDVLAAFSLGWVEIYTLNKLYQRMPMWLCPPSTRLNLQSALSDTTTAAASQRSSVNYGAMAGPAWDLCPFTLQPSMQFKITLNWATAQALPSGVAGRIGVVLRGIKYLVAQ